MESIATTTLPFASKWVTLQAELKAELDIVAAGSGDLSSYCHIQFSEHRTLELIFCIVCSIVARIFRVAGDVEADAGRMRTSGSA